MYSKCEIHTGFWRLDLKINLMWYINNFYTDNMLKWYSGWNTPGKNTGVGSHSLFQGIFPTQGTNPCLPHCRQTLLPSELTGKPKNTGVGSHSLLQGTFLTLGLNRDPCIVGRFFISWATREAHIKINNKYYYINFTILNTFNMATRKFKMIYEAHIIVLLDYCLRQSLSHCLFKNLWK